MPKKGEYVKFQKANMKKNKVTVYNLCSFWKYFSTRRQWKQNSGEFYTNKYEKHIAGSYGYYKLVCVDDKFSNPFKTYLGKHVVYNVINNMIKGSKYCSDVIKNISTKNLWWIKKTRKILRTLLNVRPWL